MRMKNELTKVPHRNLSQRQHGLPLTNLLNSFGTVPHRHLREMKEANRHLEMELAKLVERALVCC